MSRSRRAFAPLVLAGLLATGATPALIAVSGEAAAADVFAPPPAAPVATTEDWYLTIGASIRAEPTFPGADNYSARPGLIFSISKASGLNAFKSVDDSPSFAIFDTGTFRFGPAGTIDWGRSASDSDRLRGLGDLDYSLAVGGFAEWYPIEWLRLRGELLYGFGGYDGITGQLGADFIFGNGPWRWAIGPRLSFAGSGYMQAYFGVSPFQSVVANSLLNPLPVFNAGGGFDSAGLFGQVTYAFGNGFTGGVFGSYNYLLGDAGSSPLTSDSNQFMAGVSLSYTFNIGKAWW